MHTYQPTNQRSANVAAARAPCGCYERISRQTDCARVNGLSIGDCLADPLSPRHKHSVGVVQRHTPHDPGRWPIKGGVCLATLPKHSSEKKSDSNAHAGSEELGTEDEWTCCDPTTKKTTPDELAHLADRVTDSSNPDERNDRLAVGLPK